MSAPGASGSGMPPGPPPGGPSVGMSMIPAGPPAGGPMYGAGAYPGFPGVPPPPMMPNFPPPLPPGWSEHTAPDGVTKYYYNAQTKVSTYKRPVATAPATPPPVAAAPEKKKKKEKAKVKVPVPGTEWTRITTNEGNVFYFDKANKRSEWTVPEEIAEAVAALEASEKAEKEEKIKQERLERLKEKERVRAQVDEERRKAKEAAEERKRKAQDGADEKPAKVAKTEDEEQYEPEGEDEEAWKKAVAAEFAESDAAKAKADADEEAAEKKAEEEAAKKVFAVDTKVKVSAEEGRALFKALLIEKNISPFAPWDQSLPLFITDPRYVLLPSEKARREVYEEYCRDAGRQRRLNKPSAVVENKVDSERDYRALMREEVTSTRTRFDDFKRKHKKDKRFYSYGRDDREREKAFKVHLRELGERKRADAARAEADFFELLNETSGITPESTWADVKNRIYSDTRYDAVGSSSLRAELFGTHVKKLAEQAAKEPETAESAAERKIRERKDRQAASLREREAQMREQQAKISEEVDKSRHSAGREEGERLFGSLLVDVVRGHDTTWDEVLPILQQDGRFAHPALRTGDKRRIFENHIARLGANKSDALSKLFATNAPELSTPFETVYAAIADDPLVSRLGLNAQALEERFAAWRRGREAEARREFDELLGENKFVDFWGRMRKKVLDEAAGSVEEQDEREKGEGLGDGGDADMIALAQKIDLNEVKAVLRRDRRYRQFDHIPEMREQWLREYLENMEGSKGTETVHNVGAAAHR